MSKKRLLAYFAIGFTAIGILGFSLASFYGKPSSSVKAADREQVEKMVKNLYEENRKLQTEMDRMGQRHIEFLELLQRKEEESKTHVGLIQKLATEWQEKEKSDEDAKASGIAAGPFDPKRVRALEMELLKSDKQMKKYDQQIEEIQKKHVQEMKGLQNKYSSGIVALEEALAREERLKTQKAKSGSAYESQVKTLRARVMNQTEFESKVLELEKEREQLASELSKAQTTIKKDRTTFFFNLGVTYISSGLYQEAANMFEKVAKLDPTDAQAHYNLGILYEEHLNDVAKGVEHYQAYLKLSKNEEDAEKRSRVRDWVSVAKHNFSSAGKSNAQSAAAAFKHIFFTDSKPA